MISVQMKTCAHSLNICTLVPFLTGDLLYGDTTAPYCQTPLMPLAALHLLLMIHSTKLSDLTADTHTVFVTCQEVTMES